MTIKGGGEAPFFTLLARPAAAVTSLLPPRARRQNGSPGGWQSCRRGRPPVRSAEGEAPSAHVAPPHTRGHSHTGREGGREGSGRDGAPLTAPKPAPGRSLAAAEEEEEEEGGEGGVGEGKKHGAASYLRCGAGSAGPAAARPGGLNAPPAPQQRAGAQPHGPPRTAACAAAVVGALLPLPSPVLLLLLAQEFLNFKAQGTSACPPLSLGHRARQPAGPRPAASPPPCPQRASGEREKREEREKGRVHEDYKVTNMAPQSLLPDHCKETKTHFKLNRFQLARSPRRPLPAQHPAQIFAN